MSKGFYPMVPPFGYKKDSKDNRTYRTVSNIIVDSQESFIVKYIFDAYSLGNINMEELSKDCNEKFPNVSPRFTKKRISYIIKNKFYIGIMSYIGIEYAHNYEHIIDKDKFNQCEIIRDKQRYCHKEIKKYKHVLKNESKKIPKHWVKPLSEGKWIGRCPFGYKTTFSLNRGKFSEAGTVYVDEQEMVIVKDIINTFSQGGHSINSLHKYIVSKYPTIKMVRKKIHHIIISKFYIGIMSICGKEFPHIFPTFITKDTYDKCQEILRNNTRYYLYKPTSGPKEEKQQDISPMEQRIVDLLESPLDLEDLSIQSNIKPSELKSILASMIERSIIKKTEYGDYARMFGIAHCSE
jgi:hypothetical protein